MRRVLSIVLLGVLALGVSGCANGAQTVDDKPAASAPSTPTVPPVPNLTSPKAAVESYTDWISYAYRIARSDVATHAFSLYEEVRVNSYIQMNKTEEQRAIEQRLVDSSYRVVSQEATRATVAGSEDWIYRYINIEDGQYSGPEHKASYDVTYTVIIEKPKGWVVDKVVVQARGDVP